MKICCIFDMAVLDLVGRTKSTACADGMKGLEVGSGDVGDKKMSLTNKRKISMLSPFRSHLSDTLSNYSSSAIRHALELKNIVAIMLTANLPTVNKPIQCLNLTESTIGVLTSLSRRKNSNKWLLNSGCLIWDLIPEYWVAAAARQDYVKAISHTFMIFQVVAALSLSSTLVHAAAAGAEVVFGAGHISQSGATTTVVQSSQNLSLNWQNFNIAPEEMVNFVQPSANSVAVNHILDSNGTQILGQVNANGQVYLINPNGILFGQGSQINVGGLVASTLDFNDANLSDSAKTFSGSGAGSIVNQGSLTAINGGYVALLGNTVSNEGVISAPKGSVVLGAGNTTTLTFQNNSLMQMQVDQSLLNSLVENGGVIHADGGQVIMNAGARNALLASVVNNTGVIEAHTMDYQEGNIILLGGMTAGTTTVSGTLDASAPNGGNGGFIETSAAHVKIADDIKVNTLATDGNNGTWLIDPADFNIGDASNGALSNLSGATLSSNLVTSDITILSSGGAANGSGDINVNEAVSWSANKLTLTAARDININDVMTASGTSTLALNTATANGNDAAISGGQVYVGMNFDGFRGRVDFANAGKGLLAINAADYTIINSVAQLEGMAITGNFALGANVGTAGSTFNFTPVASFADNFNGLGHTITGMNIAGAAAANTGMIRIAGAASDIRNVGLVDGVVAAGGAGTGGLIGSGTTGIVSNSYNTGTVTGGAGTGGLVGSMTTGSIVNSFASGAVTGAAGTGGLLGNMTGAVSRSHATGKVMGAAGTGGLLGTTTGVISESYATGAVDGDAGTGGLVGTATGNATNSFATGNVTGDAGTGGLIGNSTGNIENTYAAGTVSGAAGTGGLLGTSTGALTNNFWDIANNAHGVGDTTPLGTNSITNSELTSSGFPTITADNSSGSIWDFDSTWLLVSGASPILRSTLPKLIVTALDDASVSYTGAADYQLASKGLKYSLTLSATEKAYLSSVGITNTGTSAEAINAGTYSIGALYSGQTHYNISYVNSELTINPATVSLSASKTYNGLTNLTNAVNIATGVGSETLTYTDAKASDANVGTANKFINTITLENGSNGDLASNYILPTLNRTNAAVTINAKPLTITGMAATNKTYDGSLVADLTGGTLITGITGESLTFTGQTGAFTDKNVANNIAVTVTGTRLNNSASGLANNYRLMQPLVRAATISAKPLTITGMTAADKTYDASLVAALTGGTLITGITGESLTFTGQTGTFIDKNVANNIAVTVTGTRLNNSAGGLANNYRLMQPLVRAATISAKPLIITGMTATNKIYDGSLVAALTGGTPVTGITGESLTFTGQTGAFSDKNVANNIAVTVTGTRLGDSDSGLASNYSLMQPLVRAANISAKPLTITGMTATNKTYDGSLVAALTGGILVTGITGESLAFTGQTGVFTDKNVANNITVIVTGTKLGDSDGGLASNYRLIQPTVPAANINAKPLIITSIATYYGYQPFEEAQMFDSDVQLDGMVEVSGKEEGEDEGDDKDSG